MNSTSPLWWTAANSCKPSAISPPPIARRSGKHWSGIACPLKRKPRSSQSSVQCIQKGKTDVATDSTPRIHCKECDVRRPPQYHLRHALGRRWPPCFEDYADPVPLRCSCRRQHDPPGGRFPFVQVCPPLPAADAG